MKVDITHFKTEDGGDNIGIEPGSTRRTKANWYVWMKPDGSGILVIDSQTLRIELPANSKI